MKKILRYILIAAAALLTAACAKEIVDDTKPGDVPEPKEGVTFTAYVQSIGENAQGADRTSPADTKVAITIDETAKTAKVSFTAGDFIAVSDGTTTQRITLTADNINEDGSATFTASDLSAEAEIYYAYSSDKNTFNYFDLKDAGGPYVYTNLKSSSNPNDFSEIVAGRIPHAAFAAGGDGKLIFKNMLTLLKFQVSTSGVSYVEFTGCNAEGVIGMLRGKFSDESTSLINWESIPHLTVAKSYVSAAGTDCYIALAPGITLSGGFIITAYDDSGNVLFRSKSGGSFTTTAGKLIDLGTLEEHKMTPYEIWQAGYDLEIGGKTFNKADYGEAKLISTSGATLTGNSEANTDGKGGVYFLESGGDLTISWSNYYSSVIIVGNSDESRGAVTVAHGGTFYQGTSEDLSHYVLAFKNVEITNGDATRDVIDGNALGDVIFDDCRINVNRDFSTRKADTKTIESITVVNSDILVQADNVSLFGTHTVTGVSFGDVTIKNNVVWSDGAAGTYEDGREFHFINAPYANGAALGTVVFENNTFYNADSGNGNVWFERGYLTFSSATAISVKNNLSFTTAPAAKDADKTTQRFCCMLRVKGMTLEAAKTVYSRENNWHDYPQVASLFASDGKDWTGGMISGVSLSGNAVASFINPFQSFDTATGAFVMNSEYANYGAQR